MSKTKIDLSNIKENDLEKTSTFLDLMSRSERKNHKKEKELKSNEKEVSDIDDIEDMIDERKKSTKDLTIDLKKAKEEYNNINKNDDEELSKTQILDITRQMKFNFEEIKKENSENKKKGISVLNIIGEINLLCIGYYIYLLVFTNYQDNEKNYIITGSIIVLLVLLFGISVITGKKASKIFNILNILAIIGFVAYNAYTLIN